MNFAMNFHIWRILYFAPSAKGEARKIVPLGWSQGQFTHCPRTVGDAGPYKRTSNARPYEVVYLHYIWFRYIIKMSREKRPF